MAQMSRRSHNSPPSPPRPAFLVKKKGTSVTRPALPTAVVRNIPTASSTTRSNTRSQPFVILLALVVCVLVFWQQQSSNEGYVQGRNTSKQQEGDSLLWSLADQVLGDSLKKNYQPPQYDSSDEEEYAQLVQEKETTLKRPTTQQRVVVTRFDENCLLRPPVTQSSRHHHRHLTKRTSRHADPHHLGPCYATYPTRTTPPNGYTAAIDYFHFRDNHEWRQACYIYCLDQIALRDEFALYFQDASLLAEAAVMGMPRVVAKLYQTYKMDPLEIVKVGAGPEKTTPDVDNYEAVQDEDDDSVGFNAIQQAIRGGYAEIVAILTNGKNDLVIDRLGRTVEDYVRLKGSPIRPDDARDWLNLDTVADQMQQGIVHVGGNPEPFPSLTNTGYGWSQETSWPVNERCDIDIVYGSMSREMFYKEYFMTGRPFVLRGVVPQAEIDAFSKARWSQTPDFHPHVEVPVGPTAYPSMTGQLKCEHMLTIEAIEQGEGCPDNPGVPMVHARHPTEKEMQELFPMYGGNVYAKKGGWRKMAEWFDSKIEQSRITWQVFFGGDASGATLHWHKAAFNVLYVGIKEWKITPPLYRGLTGMPSKLATEQIDDSIAMVCTQRPGDFVYIPNYWGHLTVNHGFSIGAAAILPSSFQQTADDKPRIHFVHINKTGGTSILRMLQARCASQYTSERWGGNQRTFHATAHALIDRNGRDAWDNAYTFAVVRHPLARVVSNFFFLLDQCAERTNRQSCKDRRIPVDIDLLTMSDEDKIAAFHEYFAHLYTLYPPGHPEHYLLGSRGHGNEKFDSFNATQTSWLVDEQGEIAVENIFHLENISEDMGKLAEDLPCLNNNGEGQERRRELLEMVHENATPRYPDYKLFGFNKNTNRIMKEVFWMDYENFGYEF